MKKKFNSIEELYDSLYGKPVKEKPKAEICEMCGSKLNEDDVYICHRCWNNK